MKNSKPTEEEIRKAREGWEHGTDPVWRKSHAIYANYPIERHINYQAAMKAAEQRGFENAEKQHQKKIDRLLSGREPRDFDDWLHIREGLAPTQREEGLYQIEIEAHRELCKEREKGRASAYNDIQKTIEAAEQKGYDTGRADGIKKGRAEGIANVQVWLDKSNLAEIEKLLAQFKKHNNQGLQLPIKPDMFNEDKYSLFWIDFDKEAIAAAKKGEINRNVQSL